MIPHGGEEACACVINILAYILHIHIIIQLNLGTNINHRTEGPKYSMYIIFRYVSVLTKLPQFC